MGVRSTDGIADHAHDALDDGERAEGLAARRLVSVAVPVIDCGRPDALTGLAQGKFPKVLNYVSRRPRTGSSGVQAKQNI